MNHIEQIQKLNQRVYSLTESLTRVANVVDSMRHQTIALQKVTDVLMKKTDIPRIKEIDYSLETFSGNFVYLYGEYFLCLQPETLALPEIVSVETVLKDWEYKGLTEDKTAHVFVKVSKTASSEDGIEKKLVPSIEGDNPYERLNEVLRMELM
jgi:hypothetical protein